MKLCYSKWIRLVLVAMTISCIMPLYVNAANNQKFSDVVKHSYYEEAVAYLTKVEILKGYGDNTFRPENNITRAEVAKVIVGILGIEKGANTKSSFTDTREHWAEKDGTIAAIEKAGIMQGDGKGIFRPDDRVTRAEIAQVIVNAFELQPVPNFRSNFLDLHDVRWAADAIAIVQGHGLINGKGNGKYDPRSHTKRAELAKIVYEAAKKFDLIDTNLPLEPTDDPVTDPSIQREIEAIKAKWEQLKPRYNGSILEVQPLVTPPYLLGKVHEAALKDALNMTNFTRLLTGLPSNVTLNRGFNEEAQATAVVNAANNAMSHYPTQPKEMTEAMYQKGYNGASSSNISFGYRTLTESIQKGYMPDTSPSNREHVGHRRWILSPKLKEVGFGYALSADNTVHSAMKVIAPNMWSIPDTAYERIAWPAEGAFPTDFLHMMDPWSISLNPTKYNKDRTDSIVVTLKRRSDDKTWTFRNGSSKDGYFNISTDNYGYTPFTIIFQPEQNRAYSSGDRYEVKIDGVYINSGQKTTITYEVVFFDL